MDDFSTYGKLNVGSNFQASISWACVLSVVCNCFPTERTVLTCGRGIPGNPSSSQGGRRRSLHILLAVLSRKGAIANLMVFGALNSFSVSFTATLGMPKSLGPVALHLEFSLSRRFYPDM